MRFPFEPDALSTLVRLARPEGEWVLRRRAPRAGPERLELVMNGRLLMDTADGSSEEALANVTLRAVAGRPRVTALVGGLGFGFTLRALLVDPRVALVDVVEIEPALPEVLRRLEAGGWGPALRDPRVRVHAADVRAFLDAPRRRYDCVLLDVDNGPEALAAPANAALYALPGLRACRRALAPGGAVGIWSEGPAPACLDALRRAFGNAERHRVRAARDGREVDYHILLARRAEPEPEAATETASGSGSEGRPGSRVPAPYPSRT